MRKRLYAVIFTGLLLTSFSAAELFALKVPELKGRVNDYAKVLSSREEGQIEGLLTDLEQSTSAQAAVLTIPSLNGDSIEDFSIRTVDEWKLGQADNDNGVLILLALEEREVRIEVGYGLEGSLTDAKSGYIIREIMIPYFRNGDYAGGLYAGSGAVAGVVTAEADITPSQMSRTSSGSRSSGRSVVSFNFLFGILFFIFAILRGFGRAFGRRRYYRGYRGSAAGSIGSALFWSSILGSASRRNYRGGGGGFGSGGFGGGGFGGFSGGGGGFGGGGASGGW